MAAFGTAFAVAALATPLVASPLLLIYPLYRRDIRRSRERVSAGSQVIETRCGQIEHAVAGEGLPVLAVHGAGADTTRGWILPPAGQERLSRHCHVAVRVSALAPHASSATRPACTWGWAHQKEVDAEIATFLKGLEIKRGN